MATPRFGLDKGTDARPVPVRTKSSIWMQLLSNLPVRVLCEDEPGIVRIYGNDNRCQPIDICFSPQTPSSNPSESLRADKRFHDECASSCQQEILAAHAILKIALKRRRP